MDPLLSSPTAKECSICFEHVNVSSLTDPASSPNTLGDSTIRLECGHEFHKACMKKWLVSSRTCPNCRVTIVHFDGKELPPLSPTPSQPAPASPVTQTRSSWGFSRPRGQRYSCEPRIEENTTGIYTLDFSSTPLVSDQVVIAYIKQAGSSLKHLHVGNTRITKKTFKSVYKHCPNIETLDVSFCASINSKSMRKLAERCPRINNLNLAHCASVGDKEMREVGGIEGRTVGLRYLKTLDITGCEKLTDKGIRGLYRCRAIQSLKMAYLTSKVTDESMTQLMVSMPGLQYLSIRGNKAITMKTVQTLSQTSHSLRYFDMVGCPSINGRQAAQTLIRQCYSFNEFMSDNFIVSGEQFVQNLRTHLNSGKGYPQ
mmetsp:Transcript_13156/g.15954  ORF Transcript_13156/g.15954 Transcript_13156/m.15954 type:complete len:371 (-) Transcript_13156:52-1164(-)